jgi:HAD superfamily 5'-nucleotidase-like hydrolase
MTDDAPATGFPPLGRGIFCNRTLNLRTIGAIGYDMDYTLIHYRVNAWEQRAYERLRHNLGLRGWPVEHLTFDPALVIRGLVVDRELGNIVKANRFGYVKRACHGTQILDFDAQRKVYERTRIDLAEGRWVFLNTLFSLSEGCMYSQLVDLLDAGKLPEVMGYSELYDRVRQSLDEAHMTGELKAEIMLEPERFVELDPDLPVALSDQRLAGKRLLLITNSEWTYTRTMMSYAFDRFLPAGTTWRDLFDVVIVSAAKPEFFMHRLPAFEVVNDEGLLRPFSRKLSNGGVFFGGNAALVEEHLGLSGEEILYVGDHIYGDVHVTKSVLRWRTALIIRELEEELRAVAAFEPTRRALVEKMARKEALEFRYAQWRLLLQRVQAGVRGPGPSNEAPIQAELRRLRTELGALDEEIAPLAQAADEIGNTRWGLLFRTGNDKSQLARQMERYADIYLSRVSNFLYQTPYRYLRSPRGSLPHDPNEK